MNFDNYLKENAKAVNEELDLILSEFLNEVKKTNIKLLPFALGLLNSNKGGKRIRGVLVKLGYEIAGGNPNSDILKAGAGFEILHTGFLIHDDIIDESSERRGQPSLYKALGGGDHYGISQAITVGDIALYLPVKIITNTNFLGEYKLKVLKALSEIIMNTGWGQIMDVEGGDKDFINLYKTAKYTISGSMQIGALLAGADDELILKLGEFGDNLGIAFQIKDDILDKESKDLELSNSEVLKYSLKAKEIIPEITSDAKNKILLEEMIQFLIERTK